MSKISLKDKVKVKKVKDKIVDQDNVKKIVSPAPETILNGEKEIRKHTLTTKQVTSSVSALLQVIKIRQDEEKKKTLFKDDPETIMLQIVPIKVPITDMLQLRVVLPHSLAIENSDVCLITENVKKSTKNDHEPTITHYKELLKEQEIKGVTQIVPIRQLRSEYVPYETKGRFADLYDIFLIDGRIFGSVTKFLGSRFFKKNKDLIPVKLNTNRFKNEVEKALAKTVLTIHGNGDTYTVKVGFSHFSAEQLTENIFAVANLLAEEFPGSFANVRKLSIKTNRSMAIPVYISLAPANSVPVPVVQPHLPKAYVSVEGELSTLVGGHVTVLPTGEVYVKKIITEEDEKMGYGFQSGDPTNRTFHESEAENDDFVDDKEDDDIENKEDDNVAKKLGKKRKTKKDEDSSDDDVEAAEDAYMLSLESTQQLLDQNNEDDKVTKKIGMKRKTTMMSLESKQQPLDQIIALGKTRSKKELTSPKPAKGKKESTLEGELGYMGLTLEQMNEKELGRNRQSASQEHAKVVEPKRKKLKPNKSEKEVVDSPKVHLELAKANVKPTSGEDSEVVGLRHKKIANAKENKEQKSGGNVKKNTENTLDTTSTKVKGSKKKSELFSPTLDKSKLNKKLKDKKTKVKPNGDAHIADANPVQRKSKQVSPVGVEMNREKTLKSNIKLKKLSPKEKKKGKKEVKSTFKGYEKKTFARYFSPENQQT